MDSGASEHADKSIDAKQIDSPANEITDPWLRDTHELGRLTLGELTLLDKLANLDHERGTNPEMLGFFLAKAEVAEDVPAGRVILTSMVLPLGRPVRSLSLPQNLPIPLLRELKISAGGLLRLLLQGVQDVYSFCKLGHIEDPMLYSRANSQLVNARAYARHGLSVIRLKPLLNQV